MRPRRSAPRGRNLCRVRSLLSSQDWDGARWRAGVWPDVVLGGLITLTGQLELASSNQSGWHGLLHGMLLLGQTAPVAVRRVVPTAAAAVGVAALSIEALASQPTNTLSGLLAGLVLLYSVGRHARGPVRLVAVTVFAAAAVGVHMLRLPDSQVSDLAFAAIFSAAAWLVGRAMWRRELERRRAAADAQAQRDAATAALETAVADERSRIAREMHDVVAHGMGVMVVQAAAAEQLLESDPEAAREPLSTVRGVGQGALAEMRRLLGLLREGDITDDEPRPQPGLEQLPALVDQLRQAGMPITLTITGPPVSLPPGLQLCAYRIVQESLTNCLKHAGGAATEVAVDCRDDMLALRVHNAAGGPTPARTPDGTGHGLVGMRERVRLYEGTLRADRQLDGSFLVTAMLPTRS